MAKPPSGQVQTVATSGSSNMSSGQHMAEPALRREGYVFSPRMSSAPSISSHET